VRPPRPAGIAGAAERDRTGMTENLPLSLRRLDRGCRTFAVDKLAVGKAAIDEIERQGLKADDFGHLSAPFPREPHPAGRFSEPAMPQPLRSVARRPSRLHGR
jgi:hypothetical protein